MSFSDTYADNLAQDLARAIQLLGNADPHTHTSERVSRAQIATRRGEELEALSRLAETPAQAAMLRAWIGDRRIAWLGRGADLARRPDPELADAIFLCVDHQLFSIQAVCGNDRDPASVRISVRRWSRAACRGARPGGAVQGARQEARRRWSLHCHVSIETRVGAAPILQIGEHTLLHRRYRRLQKNSIGARSVLSIYDYRIDNQIKRQMIVFTEDLSKQTDRGIHLVAQVPAQARVKRITFGGQSERWIAEQIYRNGRPMLPSSIAVPEAILSTRKPSDLIADMGLGPFEVRVALTRKGLMHDPIAQPVFGMIFCDVPQPTQHLVEVMLGTEGRSWAIESEADDPDAHP
jgi:hypothetical protein